MKTGNKGTNNNRADIPEIFPYFVAEYVSV